MSESPSYQYPDLEGYSGENLQKRNVMSLDRMDHNLERIAQSLDHLVEQAQPTTLPPVLEQSLIRPMQKTPPEIFDEYRGRERPISEIAVQANPEEIVLPDGRTAPTAAIRALAEYENTWPGAVLPEARAAVAHAILSAVDTEENPPLRTSYPFCLNDEPLVREKASPCIKRADHRGKHQDNNDGVWG